MTHAGSRNAGHLLGSDMPLRRIGLASPVALVSLLLLSSLIAGQARDTLPASLSNKEFWTLTEQLSEPDGYFRSKFRITGQPALEREPGLDGSRCAGGVREAVGRVSRRRAGAELHLHRGDASAHRLHHGHPAGEPAAAPDVQGAVRDVGESRRLRRPALQPQAAHQPDRDVVGRRTAWSVSRPIPTTSRHSSQI